MLNRQSFPYQNFALRKFSVGLHIYQLNSVCHVMSQHGILKYFRPILDKKDPPEDKELPDPLSKVTTGSSSIASCSAEVTKVLKQAKRSVTKNHYV